MLEAADQARDDLQEGTNCRTTSFALFTSTMSRLWI